MPQPGMRVTARAPSGVGAGLSSLLSRGPCLSCILWAQSVAVLGTPPISLFPVLGCGWGGGWVCLCVCVWHPGNGTDFPCLPPPHALHHVAIRWAAW